jgi:hypothetical protein
MICHSSRKGLVEVRQAILSYEKWRVFVLNEALSKAKISTYKRERLIIIFQILHKLHITYLLFGFAMPTR